jgi:hypothetical protein
MGGDLNGFLRYWSTSGVRETEPFCTVMISITIKCSLTQGTTIYTVYGWRSQQFSRYLNMYGLRLSIPQVSEIENALLHYQFIW